MELARLAHGTPINESEAHAALGERRALRDKMDSIILPIVTALKDPSLVQFFTSEANAFIFSAKDVIDMLKGTNAGFLTIVLGAHDTDSSDPNGPGFKMGDQTVMLVPCSGDATIDAARTPITLQALTFGNSAVALEHPPTTVVSEIVGGVKLIFHIV
ncbi:hypothetical protein SIO70_02055 [Chitinophaga sancti]|uniref:hypothetical protein n=1 Tax=Chitinophaga sancti TaxID=1004 RepID=UPI002A7644F3|nr:hypothetical protein [Chitinophaga sancti]WPQ63645.1 hypothetical protein SIO70_02055 [Chitinophaga sancti]